MKKILILLSVLFFPVLCRAESDTSIKWKIFRSSEISGGGANSLVIATGPVIVWDVQIVSAAANGTFRIINSTSADAGVSGGSSFTFDVSHFDGVPDTYQEIFNKGLVYNSSTTGKVRVMWDWYLSVPAGQNDKGRK